MSSVYGLGAPSYRSLPEVGPAWVCEPLLPVGGLLLIYGRPKRGKSFAALQLALAIASGHRDWLGFAVHQRGRVVYLQLDTPRSLWRARIPAEAPEELILVDRDLLPPALYPFNLLQAPAQHYLEALIAYHQPVALILDTLREAHGGDEDSSRDMQCVLAALAAACAPVGTAQVLIAHSRKPSPERRRDLAYDIRGSSYLAGRVDAVMAIGRSRIACGGRSLDEQRIPVRRLPNGFFERGPDEQALLDAVLADPSRPTLRAQAAWLADQCGISFWAARKRLQRARR